MAKKVCSIIDTAYRATLEEQDDTAVWFNHILRQSGADITLLLTGNAVNYAVRGQQPPPLHFGTASIDFPPHLDEDLRKAAQAGVKLVLLRDDAVLRGIPNDALLPEVAQISREQLADLLDGFDLVWHWEAEPVPGHQERSPAMVAVPPLQHLFAPYTLRALTVRNCMMDVILQPGAPEGCL